MEDQKVLDVIAAGEKLIQEAEGQIDRMKALYSDANFNPEGCRRFLSGDQLTDEQKTEVKADLQKFKDEIERENFNAVESAKAQGKKAPRPGKMRV